MPGPTISAFTPGDLVISVYGNGDGSGPYGDNQATPITLDEITTAGTLVGSLVLPQTTSVTNGTTENAVSGEYGSSSEGSLQLSADGRSLVIMGYGVNAAAFNTGGASVYGNAALAQSTSVKGGAYTPVARVVADIGYNATIDTSTALFNIDNTNNPRSVATTDGTSFYIAGQGVKGDTTQGVFKAVDGADAATPIDTSTDARQAEIYNGQLYVSRDSTQGTGGTSNISVYGSTLPSAATSPTVLPNINGSVTLTAAQENSVNAGAVGTAVHLSPEQFFFADSSTLYIADGGNPKEGGLGDGGLQKWSLGQSGWTLDYTLSTGLNLVADTNTSGVSGLYALTGVVSGGVVSLYATTETIGDLDQEYVYSIADSLAATAAPTGESFTQVMSAEPGTNIRGIAFAPSAGTAPPTNTVIAGGTTSSGLVVTSGSTLTVQSGGAVVSASVLSGGSATVSGSDNFSIIAHGGSETVSGTATGDQVAGTQLVSAATALVSGETIENGGVVELFLKGAAATNTAVMSGGTLVISGNATATNTTVNGGAVVLESAKAVLSGALTFSGPGVLQQAAIASAGFGDLAVISGFGAGDVVDLAAVGSGATLATSVVSGTVLATVTSGAVTQSFTFAGLTASSLALGADANGAAEIVYVPPPVSNVIVSSGSTSSGLIVGSGSTLTVIAGGTAIGATILAGGMAIISGTDSGSVISAGGTETLFGSANADQVYGQQLVSAATALVTNETVHSGGVVNDFLKGAVLTGTTIQGGGTLNISGNTTASNTVLSAGGVINLQSPKAVLAGSLLFVDGGTLEETATSSAGFGDLAVISGFVSGASIDLTTLSPAGATLTSTMSGNNTVETVSGSGISESFIFAGSYAPDAFVLGADAGSGTQITTNTPCYCRGTLIETDRGDVAVEHLLIGDYLVTASGARRPIKWIGRRSYGGRFTRGNQAVLPVLIRAGALADGIPRRDLWVSPLHALFLDGLLIPAKSLINGGSITQVAQVDRVEYFHVELDTHDVILAEGAAAESFLDDDSRAMFHNARDHAALYGDALPPPAAYCASRVEHGALLEPVWQRLAARSAAAQAA